MLRLGLFSLPTKRQPRPSLSGEHVESAVNSALPSTAVSAQPSKQTYRDSRCVKFCNGEYFVISSPLMSKLFHPDFFARVAWHATADRVSTFHGGRVLFGFQAHAVQRSDVLEREKNAKLISRVFLLVWMVT